MGGCLVIEGVEEEEEKEEGARFFVNEDECCVVPVVGQKSRDSPTCRQVNPSLPADPDYDLGLGHDGRQRGYRRGGRRTQRPRRGA